MDFVTKESTSDYFVPVIVLYLKAAAEKKACIRGWGYGVPQASHYKSLHESKSLSRDDFGKCRIGPRVLLYTVFLS